MSHPPALNVNLSNDSNNSPIFKLPEDLVWRIFLFNADLNDEMPVDFGRSLAAPLGQDPGFITNGLTVTRWTSQVCQSWRSLILNSTAIWGRLIDLNTLRHPSRMWTTEVLKRTGNALLDVKGKMLGMSLSMTPLFWFLVHRHWARIRSLDISIFGVSLISEDTWEFLKQPAPHMQVLAIDTRDRFRDKPDFFSKVVAGLLAGGAPCLRELRLTDITFDPSVPRLANLRVLDLGSLFSLHQLFEVLRHTPILETLVLRSKIVDDPHTDGESAGVILPRLRNINISQNLNTCLAVLESISPASVCALSLTARNHMGHDTDHDVPFSISRLQRIVSRFSKAYFSTWRATQVHIEVAVNSFRFAGRFTTDTMKFPSTLTPEFKVDIYHSITLVHQASLSILGGMSNHPFTNVSTLAIHTFPPMLSSVDSQFTSFIVSLSSVEELHATPHTLGLLVGMPPPLQDKPSPVILFPQLRTLVVESEFDKLLVAKFLSWKKEVGGNPIELLDLRKVWTSQREKFYPFCRVNVLQGRTQSARLKAWLKLVRHDIEEGSEYH